MDELQIIERRLQDLMDQWDALACDAHRQGVEEEERYFHGIELGFELARAQLAQVLADALQARTVNYSTSN
jgi:hypothetical protein